MRLSSTALLLAALALGASVRAQTPIVLQAESGTVADRDPSDTNPGAEVRTSDSNVSGATGPFVAMQGGTLTLDISAVPPGEYRLSALYASPFGAKIEKVTVDGVSYVDRTDQCGGVGFTFPTISAFTPKTIANPGSSTVRITGTTNTLVVTTCYGYTYFDTFTFTPVVAPPPGTASYTIQAESGTVGVTPGSTEPGAEVRTSDSNVSGATGPFVALQKGVLTLDISAVPAGQYRLSASYASPFGTKIENVTVDGTKYLDRADQCGGGFTFATRSAFAPIAIANAGSPNVTINGTTGTLVVKACYGYTYFDAFTLTPVGTVAKSVFDGPGWRLLSAPVQDVTVGTLAGINLVQGIAGQYPQAGANLLTSYAGGTFAAPASQADALEPGRGFFWYLYDQNIPPTTNFGGGTSRSFELSNFTLNASGPVLTQSVQRAFAFNATNGFYMIGNPFARALATSGVTLAAGGGTLSTNLQAYNPNGGTYQVLSGEMAPWQGVFAEVTGGTAPAFAFDYAATTSSSPALVGRTAVTSHRFELALSGETAGGAVLDRALVLRLEDDAEVGWDRHDGSKMPPPDARPLVAIRGDRLGAPAFKAVESLPASLETETTLVLAFETPAAGTFALSAPDGSGFPEGWRVEARDLVTGRRADLTAGQTLSFTSEATEWTDRFAVVVSPARTVATAPALDAALEVEAVAPNPTAGRARVSVRTGRAQDVSVHVFDALGRQVARLHEGPLAAGTSSFDIDTAGFAPGAYVVRVSGAEAQAVRRFMVVR